MPEASKLNTHHDEKSNGVHFFLNTNYLPRGSQEEAGYTTVMGQNTHTHRGWRRQYFVRSEFHTRFIFPWPYLMSVWFLNKQHIQSLSIPKLWK